jgi:hypothetical protein
MPTDKPTKWFDEKTLTPLIADYAKRLDSFLKAAADGEIDAAELHAQEQRVVALMKEVEPQLDPKLHEKVTELLCELTAYDIMQSIHVMQEARPKVAFRG